MKKFRALTASILASAMAMSMTTAFVAFADDVQDATEGTSYTITVENKEADKAKHTYEAYQIFTGTMKDVAPEGEDEKMQLEVTGWGAGVNPKALVDALKANDKIKSYFASVDALSETSSDEEKAKAAKDVADILSNTPALSKDDAPLQEFAKIAAANITEECKTATAVLKENVYVADIEVGDAGYYLIKDTKDSPIGTMEVNGVDKEITPAGQTRYILTPTTALTPKSKADYPTIDKNISVEKDGKTELVDFNTAAIGDIISYQLDSKVPDMDGYNKYYYVVNDTMSKGLTLQYNAVDLTGIEVKIGDITLTNQNPNDDDVNDTEKDHEFYVETTAETDGSTKIKIVFKNFKQYQKGDKITIKYDALLNDGAILGSQGNPNFVDLTFSNNPNFDYEGTPGNPPEKPDEPNPERDEPVGETPKVKVITYTTAIKLTKVDAADLDQTLKGAEFTIEGDSVKSVLKAATEYLEDADGTYYKLTDDTYTTTAPTPETEDKYDSIDTKYKKVVTATNSVDSTYETKVDMKIGDDGVLELKGLNPGTYTITETKEAEGGYLLSKTPAIITITADPSLETCDWTYECSGVKEEKLETNGTLSFKFTNVKGIVLPGTGAFGSKLIYALGALFTGTGAAYMVSKKKSKKEEE